MVKLYWQHLNPRPLLILMRLINQKLIHSMKNKLILFLIFKFRSLLLVPGQAKVHQTNQQSPISTQSKGIQNGCSWCGFLRKQNLRLIIEHSPREAGEGREAMKCQIIAWSWSGSSLSWQWPGLQHYQRPWGEWGQEDQRRHIRDAWYRGLRRKWSQKTSEAYGNDKALVQCQDIT